MIKNYLYLINVEVSRSINFNFNRQSADKLPTDYQQSADMLPTVGRLSADRSLKLWKKLSANSRPTVGRQSVEVSCSSQLPESLLAQWIEQSLTCIHDQNTQGVGSILARDSDIFFVLMLMTYDQFHLIISLRAQNLCIY